MNEPGFDTQVIRAAYAAVADDYLASFGGDLARLDLDRRLLDTLAGYAASTGRVLDVGCGPAHIGRYLATRGIEVIGADLTPAMLAAANREVPRLALVAADVRALPVRSSSVAGITAFYVLQHLPRAALQAVLDEFRRVLVRDGTLLVVAHEGESEFEPATGIKATRYTGHELAAHCDRASLRVESVHRRGPLPHEHQGDKCYVLARAR